MLQILQGLPFADIVTEDDEIWSQKGEAGGAGCVIELELIWTVVHANVVEERLVFVSKYGQFKRSLAQRACSLTQFAFQWQYISA